MRQKRIRIGLIFIFCSVILTVVSLHLISPRFSAEAVTDPVLVDIALEKTTFNTDGGSDTITLYARASTAEAGGNISIRVSIAPAKGCKGNDCWQPQAQSQYLHLSDPVMGECVVPDGFDVSGLTGCGSHQDGVFSKTFTFPQYSALGDWIVYEISINDGLGGQSFNVPISTTTFTATTSNGERNIAFKNTGSLEDTTAPVIVDYVFSPSNSIDTSDSSISLTMYARISEDMTTVRLTDTWGDITPTIMFAAEEDPGFPNPEEKAFEFSLMTDGCDALPVELDVSGLVGCGDEKKWYICCHNGDSALFSSWSMECL